MEEKKDKGKGMETVTETPSKEEREEKVEFKSRVKWESGWLFGTPAPRPRVKGGLVVSSGVGETEGSGVGGYRVLQ